MSIYRFNRRTVEDQVIYVEADNLTEAWRKARADQAFETDDTVIRSASYSRLTDRKSA